MVNVPFAKAGKGKRTNKWSRLTFSQKSALYLREQQLDRYQSATRFPISTRTIRLMNRKLTHFELWKYILIRKVSNQITFSLPKTGDQTSQGFFF